MRGKPLRSSRRCGGVGSVSGEADDVVQVQRVSCGGEVVGRIHDVVLAVVVDRGDDVQRRVGLVAHGMPDAGADEQGPVLLAVGRRAQENCCVFATLVPEVDHRLSCDYVHGLVFGAGAVGVRAAQLFAHDGVDAREGLRNVHLGREAGAFDDDRVGIDRQFDQKGAAVEDRFDDADRRCFHEHLGRGHGHLHLFTMHEASKELTVFGWFCQSITNNTIILMLRIIV